MESKTILKVKSGLLAVLLMVLTISCDDTGDEPMMDLPTENQIACGEVFDAAVEDCSTETIVEANRCVLKEVIFDGEINKYVLAHDGSQYDKVEYYELILDSLTLMWSRALYYDASGQIERSYQTNRNGTAIEMIFRFEEPAVFVDAALYDTLGNLSIDFGTTEVFYKQNPLDSLYTLDYRNEVNPDGLYLTGWNQGNNDRFFEYDEDGTCSLFESTWQLTSLTYYDDRPNWIDSYAMMLTTGFEMQFPLMANSNNWIAVDDKTDDDPALRIECHAYLTNGNGDFWIKRYLNRTYFYDCEG